MHFKVYNIMASQLYVLYEHASGYGLFWVKEAEDIGALLPTVERAITDLSLFASTVKLISFSPFKSSTNALDNINAVSEGLLHDDLKAFLGTNVPKSGKAQVLLGIGDTRVSGVIQEELGIKCTTAEVVSEILRGIRLHFPNMVKGLTMQGEAKAQLGLGHSYSRAKVKFNVNRADNMIIQSIALLDQLDKDINTFSMRVKEWYSYHFPELAKIAGDNYMYCRLAKLIGNRKAAPDDLEEKLEEITMDSSKAQAIVSASKMSMGMDVSPIDLINIESFCSRVISLSDYRRSLVEYLHKRMQSVAPNLSTLIGDVVGARLISHAGSLTNLAKYPASTVQILGAEKALFRALKQRGNTPKYGLIFHSTFIGRAGAKNKGRISRFLANKCSIASRIDCFTEIPNSIFGEKLKDQVEERLKFYETGDAPRKNAEVMKEAVIASSLLKSQQNEVQEHVDTADKKKKKKKKRKSEVDTEIIDAIGTEDTEEPKKKKSKKDKKSLAVAELPTEASNGNSEQSVIEETKEEKSKKKKKKSTSGDLSQKNESFVTNTTEENVMETTTEDVLEKPSKKKKKKKSANLSLDEKLEQSFIETSAEITVPVVTESEVVKPKKKKKKSLAGVAPSDGVHTDSQISQVIDLCGESPKKKKKKAEVAEPPAATNGAEKKKKKKALDVSALSENTDADNSSAKPKKKKKNKVDV